MKIRRISALICLVTGVVSRPCFSMETVIRCKLGLDGRHSVELLRDRPVSNTAIFYIRKDGASPHRLYQGDEDQSRGDSVKAVCAGTKERAFVISGEFTSNYLQGVAIRYNTKLARWERVEFAERSRPAAVHFPDSGMEVVFDNVRRNESGKRYIVYRYDSKKSESEQTWSNHLPRTRSQSAQIPDK